MRISDWSSDVCSSDLVNGILTHFGESCQKYGGEQPGLVWKLRLPDYDKKIGVRFLSLKGPPTMKLLHLPVLAAIRSEEHTSELQSLMRISYAVFCLKKKNNIIIQPTHINTPSTIK